uniref:Uncharacterized protein n=1 Tax=Odontella aurita TaxID=265563 RepID=A0A7S4J206_9STRA
METATAFVRRSSHVTFIIVSLAVSSSFLLGAVLLCLIQSFETDELRFSPPLGVKPPHWLPDHVAVDPFRVYACLWRLSPPATSGGTCPYHSLAPISVCRRHLVHSLLPFVSSIVLPFSFVSAGLSASGFPPFAPLGRPPAPSMTTILTRGERYECSYKYLLTRA